MNSITQDKQVFKSSVSSASSTSNTTSCTSSNTTLYAANPSRDHHNLKRELTTSFKDSYKSLSKPKPEQKPRATSPDSSKGKAVSVGTVEDDGDRNEDKRETSALKEAGIWASKVFNHSMATRGLH